MSDDPGLLQSAALALRAHGPTAAITALIGGCLGIAAAVARMAFTNAAMLERLEHELTLERARADRQRAEDRAMEADRLERIETDIRALRDLMFDIAQRGRGG
jgi:hypothetical protein